MLFCSSIVIITVYSYPIMCSFSHLMRVAPRDVGEIFDLGRTNLKLVRRPCESDKIL